MSRDPGSIPTRRAPDELMQVAINCPSGAIRVDAPRRRSAGGQSEGQHDHDPREWTARSLCRDRPRRRANWNARHPLPMRPIEEQTLLRRIACRRGLRQHRRTADCNERGGSPSATASSPSRPTRRTARRRRPCRDLVRHGTHDRSRRADRALPLRPFGPKALLRRQPREGRVRRALERRDGKAVSRC